MSFSLSVSVWLLLALSWSSLAALTEKNLPGFVLLDQVYGNDFCIVQT